MTGSWGWWTRRRRAPAAGPADTSDPATAPNPFFVVAHVPLEALVEESGETSELAGELEHHGLIDVETVQRIACDATVVVAVDDEAGHTMYEGRARRFPSGAQRREIIRRDRHCRFPGCTNVDFCRSSTTSCRGNLAVQPTSPTWSSCANTTMGWCTEKAGPSRATPIRTSHRRPQRPGHGLAPFAPLDEGDGRLGGTSAERTLQAIGSDLSRLAGRSGIRSMQRRSHPCATLVR